MHIRYSLPERALANIQIYKDQQFPNINTTKGYIVSRILEDYEGVINGVDLEEIFLKYKSRENNDTISTNLNLTQKASDNVLRLKLLLEQHFEVKFYAANVIDFVLISALSDKTESEEDFTDEQLLTILLGLAYDISRGKSLGKTRKALVELVRENGLLNREVI